MKMATVTSQEEFEGRVSVVFDDGFCLDTTKPTDFDNYYRCLLTAPDGRRINFSRLTLKDAIRRASLRP